jgi:hypothetical protein
MLADFGGAKFIWKERKDIGDILTSYEGSKFLERKRFE